MDRALAFFGGAAVGAATMYYFDPDRGRGRRAECEARWAAHGRRAARNLDKAGRDLAHRARGLVYEAAHMVRGETPSEDGHRPMSLDILNEHLAPGTRLLLGALGGGLFALGVTQKAPEACVLGTIGAALAWPAVSGQGAGVRFGLGEAGEQATRVSRPEIQEPNTERRGERVPVM
jgi:hypothetical protein